MPLGISLQVLLGQLNAGWAIMIEVRCVDCSPWVQKTNVIPLKNSNSDVVEDLFSSSEVSLVVGGRSVDDAADG